MPMRFKAVVLTLVVILTCAPFAIADETSITFCESGKTVVVKVQGDINVADRIVLKTFNRIISGPFVLQTGENIVTLAIPEVRVATLFRVELLSNKNLLNEIIAYPPNSKLNWRIPSNERHKVQKIVKQEDVKLLCSNNVPEWFLEWAKTRGAEVLLVCIDEKSGKIYSGDSRIDELTGSLLILGRTVSENPLKRLHLITTVNSTIPVFVLDTTWLGELQKSPCVIHPTNLQGPLQQFRNERWSQSISFTGFIEPFEEIINRKAWVQGKYAPLLESVLVETSQCFKDNLLLNYVPWEQQLGRNEIADLLFYRLLLKAASNDEAECIDLNNEIRLQHFGEEDASITIFSVLKQALKSSLDSETRASIELIDLRGDGVVMEYRLATCLNKLQEIELKQAIILGTTPFLEESFEKDARLAKHVIWLKEDTLPSSKQMKIQLMQELSAHRIYLGSLKSIIEQSNNSHN